VELALISGLFGLVGTGIGVVLGHSLARQSQHAHWVEDHRRGEFRTLLTAINESFLTLITTNLVKKKFDAETRVARIVMDRIFIASEVKDIDLMNRWTRAAARFRDDRDPVAFGKEVTNLSEELRNAALRDIKKN